VRTTGGGRAGPLQRTEGACWCRALRLDCLKVV
jgi:hypothetical protein